MFRFFKNIFAKKETEKEEVTLDELENWFNEKTKTIFNNLDDGIEDIKLKINQEIMKCLENIKILEKAELKNPKIPLRAKQAMEGNREAYIKRVKLFLDGIHLKHSSYDNILEFCGEFDEQLNGFAKSTSKSYQILQEFFANESSKVSMSIRILDGSIKKLKELIRNSGLEEIKEIKDWICGLKGKIDRKNSLEKEISDKQKSIEEKKKSKESLKNEINIFKKSQAFADFQNLINEKESVKKEIYNHENTLLHSFSVLEKAFKKFSRIVFEDEKTVKNYAASPLKTLMEDKELNIMKILNNLEKNIAENKLDLDEKKKRKSLDEIKKLNKDFFINFLKTYNELGEKLNRITNGLENNESDNKDLELSNKLSFLNSQTEKLENNINNLKKEFEKINIQEMKNDLQEKISKMLNENVVIS